MGMRGREGVGRELEGLLLLRVLQLLVARRQTISIQAPSPRPQAPSPC